MPLQPILTAREENGETVPLLVWALPTPMVSISSAPLGGGTGVRHWVVHATVPMSYARDDPDAHLGELARGLALDGPGVGLLTGVDVSSRVCAVDEGVEVWATVGIGAPIWAASDERIALAPRPGTINIVAFLPVRLSEAALVNAVATVTEAKVQALIDLGYSATGTATDAVTVLCPADDGTAGEPYGGPRSLWGSRLARATYAAVVSGGREPTVPWSRRPSG